MSRRSDLVFGFLANEVRLLERAKAYGIVTDLPPDAIESYKSKNYTDAELAECQWYHRSLAMLNYVRQEIILQVDIPDLELRAVWVGEDACLRCFSLPLEYASKRTRTPEMQEQMKLLAKLIESRFPPSLFCAVSAPLPPDMKGHKIPLQLANHRIKDLPSF